MHQKNDEQTLDIIHHCYESLRRMGVPASPFLEEYVRFAFQHVQLQKALSVANRHSQAMLEIESLEEILSKVDYHPGKG